ncbi:ribosome maturation factor RimM [Palleronia rufa]|uniref:ribosome maturation factor RimM n=1 Tax=Palleronia rufa TaxID=1530186 RepID=UPI00055CB515|nr:ribosome maturation factor RimM [Palleronia rufa]
MTDLICIGAVAGAYGTRGEVRLKSFCAEPSDIAAYGPLLTEDGARSFDLSLGVQVKNGFAARLSGIRTRAEAEALRGLRLHVPRDRLPEPEEDEFYHVDLIGLTVVDTGGSPIGTVSAVVEQGGGELLEIALPGRAEAALVPFTRAMVPTVDLASGRIVADPPDGLLPDTDDG